MVQIVAKVRIILIGVAIKNCNFHWSYYSIEIKYSTILTNLLLKIGELRKNQGK
ncbi:MAG: DUF4022 family protein [Bacteroidota bacterium]